MGQIIKRDKNLNMKRGAMEQMLLWIILFISFVAIFFMIIEYSNVIRVKEAAASIANFGGRTVAVNNTDIEVNNSAAEQAVVDRINDIRSSFVAAVAVGDLNCTLPGTTGYKVTFTVQVNMVNDFVPNNQFTQSVGVFNEMGSEDINCTLTISGN